MGLASSRHAERIKHLAWHLRAGAELGVPTGLGDLLRERVMRLEPSVDSTLKAADAVGHEFRYEVLRRVVMLSDGDLLDALDVALVGHLLEETPEGYRFHHPLLGSDDSGKAHCRFSVRSEE